MLPLFESLYMVCISMIPQLIWKKIKEILKSHAYYIHVAYKTVGLLSCWTSDRIPFSPSIWMILNFHLAFSYTSLSLPE